MSVGKSVMGALAALLVPSAPAAAQDEVLRVQLDGDRSREVVRVESDRCEQSLSCSRVVVRDGRRRVALTAFNQRPRFEYGWSVARVGVRDFTGDGRGEIVWELETVGGTVSSPTLMGVDRWNGRRASRIFAFSNVDAAPEPGFAWVVTAGGEIVEAPSGPPEIETIESLHRSGDANCCPSAYRRLRHRWDGQRISPLPETRRVDDASAGGRARYTLGTFNMAGGNLKHGDRSSTAGALSRSIVRRDADIVFLQETCQNMTDQLERDLEPKGWSVVFAPTGPRCVRDHKRDRGSAFGLGIVYRSALFSVAGAPQVSDLPSRHLEQRKIVCLDINAPRAIFACSTHFTAGSGKDRDANRREQAEAVMNVVSPAVAAGRAVLLGGDLNATPRSDSLDPLWDARYGGGAFGPFFEVDSGPSWESGYARGGGDDTTRGRKIDYIFVRGVSVTGGDVGRSKYSDHAPVWGER